MAAAIQERTQSITVVLKGPAVPEGARTYPFIEVSEILLSTAAIIRRSAASVVSERYRGSTVELTAAFPSQGSYVQDFLLQAKYAFEGAVPLLAAVNLPEIISHINDMFDFVKHMRDLIARKKKPRILDETEEDIIVGADGQKAFRVNRKLLSEMSPSVADYQNLLAQLNPERFQQLTLRTPEGLEIAIDYQEHSYQTLAEQRKLRSEIKRLKSEAKGGPLPRRLESPMFEPMTLSGEVRAFDLDANSGQFQTDGNGTIPPGTYPFTYKGAEPSIRFRELLGMNVVMDCAVERLGQDNWKLLASSIRPGSKAAATT